MAVTMKQNQFKSSHTPVHEYVVRINMDDRSLYERNKTFAREKLGLRDWLYYSSGRVHASCAVRSSSVLACLWVIHASAGVSLLRKDAWKLWIVQIRQKCTLWCNNGKQHLSPVREWAVPTCRGYLRPKIGTAHNTNLISPPHHRSV